MNESASLVLQCSLDGKIRQILRNTIDSNIRIQNGMPFARLAAAGSLSKALSFMTEIYSTGAAFDWEINIQTGEKVKTMHFTGGKAADQIMVVGAGDRKFSLQLFEEMIRIKNEQTNVLRAPLKEQVDPTLSMPDESEFDELSRLNNELVSMQRELAKKNAELAHLDLLKNQFLGMAAHDLRNPLQSIMAYSDFLLEDISSKLDPSQVELLKTIHDQSRYMAHLVNDLLDVAKIESGNLQLDLQLVDLVQLAQANLARNRLLASRKNITLSLESVPVPTASLDAVKIEQVLDNLVSNAIKYSPPGSSVQICIRSLESELLISVKDEGPGVPAERMSRLFQPFQRGPNGTSGEKSTGLGLTIVKRIVEGHGGRIWLESRVGGGTTFFVSFPLKNSNDQVRE